MKTSDFDYVLPPELIAQEPVADRPQARMLVVDRRRGMLRHSRVAELPEFMRPGDLLVLNDTRVIPARLLGHKAGSGGSVELLLVEEIAPDEWETLWRAARPPRPGTTIVFAGGDLTALVLVPPDGDRLRVRLQYRGVLLDLLERVGRTPLPPYIRRDPAAGPVAADRDRYQTVYARVPGAVAAPTAGLHFTGELLERLELAGVARTTVTLHVGPGTFRPVTVEDVAGHRMDAERYIVPEAAACAISATRARAGRVVAVGSTVVRTLETVAAGNQGAVVAGEGRSRLFIRPPYDFQVVDAMLTNFHLPRSTLLMMVSALAGLDLTRAAYAAAVTEGYRFYSYGDCMLIV
ncbi:MAG: tRNA preQ1(34) S-adenosylmethionine ribosyltransferase-isomerase QueA [Kiritimatiellia bacterium]|nr:tRNA preQ1(34) S-adenosylmethionine ribosyltransferase-isomerase QueA [Lentisphaerota bacterium]